MTKAEKSYLAWRVAARALLRGRFVLSSGATSDKYLDKMLVVTDPPLLELVAAAMADPLLVLLEALRKSAPRVDVVLAAPELGAVPLVAAIAPRVGATPWLIVRKEAKGHGTLKRVEGRYRPEAAYAVLVEDVVTSGKTSLESARALESAGVAVSSVFCLLDRQEGGGGAIGTAGYGFASLLTMADLLEASMEAT